MAIYLFIYCNRSIYIFYNNQSIMLSSYLYCVCMERPSKTDRSIPPPTVRASGGLLGDQPDPAAPADPADQRPHHDIIHHLRVS